MTEEDDSQSSDKEESYEESVESADRNIDFKPTGTTKRRKKDKEMISAFDAFFSEYTFESSPVLVDYDMFGLTPVESSPVSIDPNFRIDFDQFDGLILQTILSFLPSARDLLYMTQCSKRLASLVTYEHIIRASILGPITSTILGCIPAIGNNLIYVPSKMRLLRLANGKCCERGSQCSLYNLVEGSNPKVKFANSVGLFVSY